MTPGTDDPGVLYRTDVRPVDGSTFERIRARIDAGLDWGVGALCERQGDVLLVHQEDQWMLPGGGVEPGETHRDALVREVREETGLDATVGALRSVTEQTFRNGNERVSFEFAIYDASVMGTITDDPGLDDENVAAVDWFPTLPADTLDRSLLRTLLGRD